MPIKYILTDIEGTTSSVSFVYEILFPYFRENIFLLKNNKTEEIKFAFEETKKIAFEFEKVSLQNDDEVIEKLLKWSLEDKKITPLKSLQGILWKKGYESGVLKGHVYEDVPSNLKTWKDNGILLGVFSSGSIEAQKLIFAYSLFGDLRSYFSNYFDTKTGGKRETETYTKIANLLGFAPQEILFLSDIREELEAANNAKFQTVQLVRENTTPNWTNKAKDFNEVNIFLNF